uniref:Putative secreted protein n=1 Tax=Anopheles darlingi TaxID=43151 RepID=A0A2M4D332_ANODA
MLPIHSRWYIMVLTVAATASIGPRVSAPPRGQGFAVGFGVFGQAIYTNTVASPLPPMTTYLIARGPHGKKRECAPQFTGSFVVTCEARLVAEPATKNRFEQGFYTRSVASLGSLGGISTKYTEPPAR